MRQYQFKTLIPLAQKATTSLLFCPIFYFQAAEHSIAESTTQQHHQHSHSLSFLPSFVLWSFTHSLMADSGSMHRTQPSPLVRALPSDSEEFSNFFNQLMDPNHSGSDYNPVPPSSSSSTFSFSDPYANGCTFKHNHHPSDFTSSAEVLLLLLQIPSLFKQKCHLIYKYQNWILLNNKILYPHYLI